MGSHCRFFYTPIKDQYYHREFKSNNFERAVKFQAQFKLTLSALDTTKDSFNLSDDFKLNFVLKYCVVNIISL